MVQVSKAYYTEEEAKQRCQQRDLEVINIITVLNDVSGGRNRYLTAHAYDGHLTVFNLRD